MKTLEARIQQLEADSGVDWKTKYETEVQAHHSSTEGFAFERAGISADDHEIVKWTHSRIPEAERPPLNEYLQGAAREHRHLSHLFAATDAPPSVAGEPPPAAAPPAAAPPVNEHANVVVPNPGTPPGPGWQSIDNMSDADFEAKYG